MQSRPDGPEQGALVRWPCLRALRLGLAGLALSLGGLAGGATGLGASPPAEPEAAGWQLDKRANGIEVYTRPVAGSGIREFKGTVVMPVDVEAILALLRDSDRFHTWFPDCPESRLLARDGAVTHQYSVMATPWPVSDRDNVFRAVTRRDAKDGRVDIEITADPDFVPEHPDRVRVRHARGAWRLEPLDPTRTHVTFVMHLDPGGGLPQWLVNARVVETPFEALTNLRTTLGAPGS